jgi:peptidoglycan/LPS O-acetylase OafA/YrhL
MGLGQASKDEKSMSFWCVLLLVAMYFVIRRFFGITTGTAWMLVPLILTFFIALTSWCKGCWLDSVLNFLGKISLESYLTNITLNTIFRALIPTYFASSLFYGRWLEYLLVIIVGIAVACFVNKVSEIIETKRCDRT